MLTHGAAQMLMDINKALRKIQLGVAMKQYQADVGYGVVICVRSLRTRPGKVEITIKADSDEKIIWLEGWRVNLMRLDCPRDRSIKSERGLMPESRGKGLWVTFDVSRRCPLIVQLA